MSFLFITFDPTVIDARDSKRRRKAKKASDSHHLLTRKRREHVKDNAPETGGANGSENSDSKARVGRPPERLGDAAFSVNARKLTGSVFQSAL